MTDDGERRGMVRAVGILAAVITLFGAAVGAYHVYASNRASTTGRESQQLGIERGATDVRTQSEYQYQVDVQALAAEYDRRALLAQQRGRQAEDPAQRASFEAEVRLYSDISASIVSESTVLQGADQSAAARDDRAAARATALDRYEARLETATNRIDLERAAAAAESARAGKAGDTYVAIVALMAVALFLVGLSLTIAHQRRFWLVVPALALFVAGAAWAALTATRGSPHTPRAAIEAVVEGNRKLADGDAPGAQALFTRALEHRGDYAEAYARRADALLERATVRVGDPSTGTLVVRDQRLAERSIADARRALALGYPGSDTRIRLGALLALVGGRYRDAAAVTREATLRHPSDPLGWLDLAVYDAALGETQPARAALARGLELARDARNATVAPALFSGARTELERVASRLPQHRGLVRSLEQQVTIAAFEWRTHKPVPATNRRAVGVIGRAIFSLDAGRIVGTRVVRAPVGAPVVYLWYTRSGTGRPWAEVLQQFGAAEAIPASLGLPINAGEVGQPEFDPGVCAGPEEFRLDVYAGSVRVSSDVARDAAGAVLRTASGINGAQPARDAVLGLEACRPPGWRAASDPNAGAFVVTSPDGATQLRMGSLPLLFSKNERDAANVVALADTQQLELTPEGTVTAVGQPRTVNFGGTPGLIGDYVVDTATGRRVASIGASAGDDGVLRFFVVTGPENQRAAVDALRDSVRFTPGPPAASVLDR